MKTILSVDIVVDRVWVLLPHPLVGLLQHELEEPRNDNNAGGKHDASGPGGDVARSIGLGPEVWHVNRGAIAQTVRNGERHSLLLICLADSGRNPAEEDIVDAEREADEEEDGEIASSDIESRNRDDEPDKGDCLADCDVPGSLVVATRGPSHGYTESSGEDIRRRHEHEGDCALLHHAADDGGQEILEADGAEMEVVGGDEDPGTPVGS